MLKVTHKALKFLVTSIVSTLDSNGTNTTKPTTTRTILHQRLFKATNSTSFILILLTRRKHQPTRSPRLSLGLPFSASRQGLRTSPGQHTASCAHVFSKWLMVVLLQVRRYCVQDCRQTVGNGPSSRLSFSICTQHSAIVVSLSQRALPEIGLKETTSNSVLVRRG